MHLSSSSSLNADLTSFCETDYLPFGWLLQLSFTNLLVEITTYRLTTHIDTQIDNKQQRNGRSLLFIIKKLTFLNVALNKKYP